MKVCVVSVDVAFKQVEGEGTLFYVPFQFVYKLDWFPIVIFGCFTAKFTSAPGAAAAGAGRNSVVTLISAVKMIWEPIVFWKGKAA